MWFLVAVLLFLTGSAWAQQPAPGPLPQPTIAGQPDHKAEEPKQQAAPEQRASAPAPSIVKIPERENAQKEGKPNSTQTPNEPTEAKGWSLSEKIAAIASFIAFCQFIALGWTIREMRASAQRQLRAYLFLESASLVDGTQTDPPLPEFANVPGCVLLFKNSGQTPAYDVKSWAKIEVMKPEHEPQLVIPTLQTFSKSNIGCNSLMPKNLMYWRKLELNDIEEIQSGKLFIYIYGRIEYRDAFKRKRFSNFRARYAGRYPALKGVTFSICDTGNEAN
jgi:hypothetical protein